MFMILPVSNIFSILYCLNTVLGINTFVFISRPMFKQIYKSSLLPFLFLFFLTTDHFFLQLKQCELNKTSMRSRRRYFPLYLALIQRDSLKLNQYEKQNHNYYSVLKNLFQSG